MPVHNMSLAASEQVRAFAFEGSDSTLTSGDTGVIAFVPFPGLLEALNVSCFSVASSPFLSFTINRFIVGTGLTQIAIGTTFVPASYGTSGVLGGVGVTISAQFATGLSGVPLMCGDVIGYQVGGLGGTCLIDGMCGVALIRGTQDKKFYFNTLR